jgi:SAM-dependent methyltransferase
VLDVGAGPGAASLALAGRVGHITAVDEDDAMLATFAKLAAGAGVPAKTLHGRWPDIAGSAPVADVVLCHNVLYNVPDLEPFLTELTAHARGRVVVELSAQHPMTVLNPLWKAVHGIDRPERPTAMDAIELATALGLDPRWYAWERPNTIDHDHGFDDLVAMVTRRLCLPPERAGEVERALRKAGVTRAQPRLGPPGRETITVWWPGFAH